MGWIILLFAVCVILSLYAQTNRAVNTITEALSAETEHQGQKRLREKRDFVEQCLREAISTMADNYWRVITFPDNPFSDKLDNIVKLKDPAGKELTIEISREGRRAQALTVSGCDGLHLLGLPRRFCDGKCTRTYWDHEVDEFLRQLGNLTRQHYGFPSAEEVTALDETLREK